MRRIIFILILIITGICIFICCQSSSNEKAAAGADSSANSKTSGSNTSGNKNNYVFNIQFLPTPPKELVLNATPEQKVSFAWNEFLALNWKSGYRTVGKRDIPDLSWSYDRDSMPYPDLALWETYAHRSELRPGNDHMLPFDNPPHYNYIYQPIPAPGTSFTLFDNLDENNEIGSCNVYAHVGSYGKELQVLYQAKANREEYEYLLRNYPTKAQLLAATTNNVNNINADSAYYPGAGTSCNCPPEKKVLCLPCGGAPIPGGNGQTYTGAMEVKTAWRELVPQDDASTFFTRKVIVYAPGPHGSIFSVNKTYALIGLHIIHKTQNHPNFVFATFEHVKVERDDMGYLLLDQHGNDSGSIQAQYPRLHPIPAVVDSSTAFVHRLLKKKNPRSIWQYYRLVGVQDTPTNDTTSFNFFLANYVVESDPTLADFHGSGIGTPFNGQPNSLYQGKFLSMGGCQGCHGVAQIKFGGDCSFLMDTVDKPVRSPDIGLPGSKLQRYVTALRHVEAARLTKSAH